MIHNLRAFVAVVAQNAVWLGAYDCMENFSETTLDRELCYVFAGVMLMVGTRSYVHTHHAHTHTRTHAVARRSPTYAVHTHAVQQVDVQNVFCFLLTWLLKFNWTC